MKRSHLTREIVEIATLTLFIFIVIHFTLQSYYVRGVDMEPGLQQGSYVLVNKMVYHLHGPERGDVIVFHNPLNTTLDAIARVIGMPGDAVTIDASHIWVNGMLLHEPYITSAANPVGNKWVIPDNKYFVIGDNRSISEDSRNWNYLPKDFIVGKAVMVYWPVGSWHAINTYKDLFSQVKSNN